MTHIAINTNGFSSAGGDDALRESVERLNAAARESWYNDEWRGPVIAAALTETWEGFEFENLLPLLANVQTVGKDERVTFEEVRGLDVSWIAVGGSIKYSSLDSDVFEMERDRVGFALTELREKMRSGFSKESGKIVNAAKERLAGELNTRLLRLYQAALPNPGPYTVVNAGLSLPAFNAALTEVKDTSRSGMINVIGRATMTDQIINELQDLNGFTPESNERMLQLGVLGTYRKARIIELKNYRDGAGNALFPANELIIAGQDAAEVVFWGGPEGEEWNEQGGDYWHIKSHREAGYGVLHPERVRRILDSGISPND